MRRLFKIYLIVFILSFNSCYPDTRAYTSPDCSNNFKSVHINTITREPTDYHNQLVEVTGYYFWHSEQSALYAYSSERRSEKMIWIGFNEKLARMNKTDTIFLLKSLEEFKKINGKRIKIRGKVDTNLHGHLGQYAATITNICYLKILN